MSGSVQGKAAASSAYRGSGRGRRFRRGRGGGHDNINQTPRDINQRINQPRPTHFISLPLHGHETLRERVAAFTDSVLASAPESSGLERKIFQLPARLHMTLGVMNLVTTQNRPKAGLAAADMPQAGKTVEEALTMLQSLRPEVLKLLDGAGAMDIPLSGLAVMKGNKEATFAAYTGPGSTVDDSAMWKACQLIQDRFRTAGFVTENRPLQLHCTLINSTFRQPRRPFSFMSVLEAVRRNPTSAGVPPPATMTPITLSEAEKLANFGTWPVDEIHICRLGSWDQEGRYVSIGHISLRE